MKTLIIALIILVTIIIFNKKVKPISVTASPIQPPPDDGVMRIRDITIDDIKSGKNWKVINPDELLLVEDAINLEDIHISKSEHFCKDDIIVYSSVYVTEDNNVTPMVLVKEVGYCDFGGDYCNFKNGKWSQIGLVPNPNAPAGREYIANPLMIDPSFDTMDNDLDNFRVELKDGFQKWAIYIER